MPFLSSRGSQHLFLGFLASLTAIDCGTSLVELPPIGCEYLDIFLKDLSSLPPFRVINFSIDLMASTSPSSIPPYRMTPTELK